MIYDVVYQLFLIMKTIKLVILFQMFLTSVVQASDVDKMSQYQQVLYHDSIILKPIIKDNKVQSGMWICPLSETIMTDLSKVDVINIVSLSWALKHGADKQDHEKQKEFISDTANKIVVSKEIGTLRGDKGYDEQLPDNLSVALKYISNFIKVCNKYNIVYNKDNLNRIRENIIDVMLEYPDLK